MFPTANYYSGDSQCTVNRSCQSDNSSVTAYVGYLGPHMLTATQNTLNNSYHTTDLNVSYQSPPVTTGDFETDIIYQYGDLPGNAFGLNDCKSPVTGTSKCDRTQVTYDGDWICSVNCSNSFAQSVACHETGHAVGLLHGVNANPVLSNNDTSLHCLREPISGVHTMGTHNVDMVNWQYP